jgi:membrane protease subunit HflC
MRFRFRHWLILIVAVVWGQSAIYTVDQAEFAYVTRFGEPLQVFDGARDAGLHFKLPWPIDAVQRLDRRLQILDLPPVESLTRDPLKKTIDKTLAVDAFVCWQIPDTEAVDRFIRTVGSFEQAKRLLIPRISGRLAAIISQLPLEELVQISDEPGTQRRMNRIRDQLLGTLPIGDEPANREPLFDLALKEYGIQIVEIRLRRFNYPEVVRSSIAERIRSERNRKVADYQSEGDRLAREIISAADRDAAKIVADANAQKQLLEAKAEVEADRIRNEAHSLDPEFYAFLKKIKSYQALLSETKDVLLLSGKHELFDLLLSPPRLREPPER